MYKRPRKNNKIKNTKKIKSEKSVRSSRENSTAAQFELKKGKSTVTVLYCSVVVFLSYSFHQSVVHVWCSVGTKNSGGTKIQQKVGYNVKNMPHV